MSNYVNLGIKFFNIKLNIFLASYCTTHFYENIQTIRENFTAQLCKRHKV